MKHAALALALGGLLTAQAGLALSANAENHGYREAELKNQQKREDMQDTKIEHRLDRVGTGPHAGYRRAELQNEQKRNELQQLKTEHRLQRLDDKK